MGQEFLLSELSPFTVFFPKTLFLIVVIIVGPPIKDRDDRRF